MTWQKLRISLLVLAGMLFSFQDLGAQEAQVVDSKSGVPIPFASLEDRNLKISVIANEKGQVDLKDFRNAKQLIIRSVGYNSLKTSFSEIEQAGFQIRLEVSFFDLDQVVVSATRWEQNRGVLPLRIRSISPDKVALQNPQTAADLLDISGEVFIQKSQMGGGSPMIRGFSANRLLYTVDGVRMNTAIFRGGNLHNIIALDPFTISGTEVLFGPGSVIYGSDAIGAVMAFQTLQAELKQADNKTASGQFFSRYSTANEEFTGHLDFSWHGDKFSSLSSLTGTRFGDLQMGRNGPEDYLQSFLVKRENGQDIVLSNPDPRMQSPTAYDQLNLMQKFRFVPNAYWDLQYGFHYSSSTDIPRYDRIIRTRNGQPRSAEWYYGPQRWMMQHLQARYTRKHAWFDEASISFAYQFFEESRNDRDFGASIRNERIEKVDAYSFNLDLKKAVGSETQIYYGIESILNQVGSDGQAFDLQSGERSPIANRYPQADWWSAALYGSIQHQLSDRWSTQAGFRLSHFYTQADFSNNLPFFPLPQTEAEVQNTAVTGSAGVVYRPNFPWVFRLNLSTGFRAPNVDDIGKVFDSEPGSVVVPNADLAPEYAYNLELGFSRSIGETMLVDFSTYYTILDNAMVRRNFQLAGQDSIYYDGVLSQVQAIQNAAKANVYGVQAGIEWHPSPRFILQSRINWQNGEEESEEGIRSAVRHAAPLFGDIRLDYRHKALKVQLMYRYNGSLGFDQLPIGEQNKTFLYAADDQGKPYAPGWYTFNLKSTLQIGNHFELGLGLENLTNQRYRPYSSGVAGAGRNAVLSLKARW